MLDIKYIRENPDLIKKNCKNRGVDVDIDLLLEMDQNRRETQQQLDNLRAQRKGGSKSKPTREEIAQLREVGGRISALEQALIEIENEYKEILLKIPNLTHPGTPVGGEESFNVIATVGTPPQFSFVPKDHEELMTSLDLIDFERGAKVGSSKFYFTKNNLVRLNHALLSYGMDILSRHGFILMETPDMAKNEILSGLGFNPRGEEDQIYQLRDEEMSLIGTAEITMGGYHANEVLNLLKGPLKYAAISHCFRKEAGAYGRTSKGLYRVHQFTKLEMFVYCKPEDSATLHQELLGIEQEIVDGLELPYRIIDIASGDLGGPAYRKYDIEAWMTMKNDYGEITSASNCTDYQARRLNIKYKKEDGSNEFVHTLNGTAVVLSRFPLAIVENFQQADGSVIIPKVLQKYTGFERL